MPPIDPRLLPPSATQPPPQQGLPPTPAPQSFMPPTITSLPPRMVQQQQNDDARLALARQAAAREQKTFDATYEIPKPPGDLTKTGDEYLATIPVYLQTQLKAMQEGRMPYPSPVGAGSRNPQNAVLRAAALQFDPKLDASDVATRIQTRKEFESNKSGTPGNSIGSANTLLGHLNTLYQTSQALGNTGIPIINAPLNVGKEWLLGKGPIRSYGQAVTAVTEEMERLWRATGGNVTEIENWKKSFASNSSPEQFRDSIHMAANLIRSRLQTLSDRYEQGMKQSKDPIEFLRPENQALFKEFESGAFSTTGDTGDKQISATEKQIKIPEGYQLAYAQKMAAIPQGELTPEKYVELRQGLDKDFLPTGEASHLDPKEVQDFVDGFNKGIPLGKVPAMNVPLSDKGIIPGTHAFSEKDRAIAAASPLGTGITAFTNAGTGGAIDEAIGQEGREAKALNEQNNWKSAAVGDVLGSVLPITGLERGAAGSIKALARQFKVAPETMEAIMASNRYRIAGNTAANTLYGGARGLNNADEGEGGRGFLRGAAGGFVAAPIAGVLSEGVNRGLPLLGQSTLDALTKMKGVKLTTLQKLGLGRGEETFHGVPGVRGARGKSIESYNIADANNALDPIGVKVPAGVRPGSALNAYIGKQANIAYEAVKPNINGMVDKPFVDAVDALKVQATTPEKLAMWQEIKDASNLLKADKAGNFNGDSYKEASARFRHLIETWTDDNATVGAQEWAHAAMGIKKEMQNVLQRQLPPDVYSDLKNVETTWARKMEIANASNRAKNSRGVYAPNNKIATHYQFDSSSGKTRFAEGKMPGQDFTQAAQDIIGGEQVPTRNALRDTLFTLGGGLTLGGIGAVSPAAGGMLAGVGTAAYAPLVKQLVQIALTKRGTGRGTDITRRALEDYFRKQITGD